MIQENELRIGNRISVIADQNTDEHQSKIVAINPDYPYKSVRVSTDNDGNGMECSCEDINGIPTTPEILQKYGFEKDNTHLGGWLSPEYYSTRYRIYDDENGYYHSSVFTRTGFLHQLQNLIFALTRQELEYKP